MKLFSDLLSLSNSKIPANNGPVIKQRRGVEIKSLREIEIMRKSSKIVATVLSEIRDLVKPGMSTLDLDNYAEKRIREHDAEPSFKGYHGFPGSICSSINNEVVHGIPSKKKIINDGDLLKIDTGAFYNGYHGDSCITICVGNASDQAIELSRIAQEALMLGIKQIKPQNKLLDIAGAIEEHFGGAADAHFYCSKTEKSRSFDPHIDNDDNFLVHAHGSVKWTVCNNLDNKGDATSFNLTTGDLLYIPKGLAHSAVPLSKRISISVPLIEDITAKPLDRTVYDFS